MTEMISFTTQLLGSLATFLGTAPIIYLFGCICLCFVGKFIKTLFT